MFDQSRDRLRKPIPPKPEPTKLATWLCGATQQRKASEPSIGKTYSGRNCHRVTPSKTNQNTFVCFWDSGVGFCLCFFWVSKRAVWHKLYQNKHVSTAESRAQLHINLRGEPRELRVVDQELSCDCRESVSSPNDALQKSRSEKNAKSGKRRINTYPHEEDRDQGMYLRIKVEFSHGNWCIAHVVRSSRGRGDGNQNMLLDTKRSRIERK